MALGSQVKKYRKALKFTLEMLAERSTVDVGTLSAMEVRDSAQSKFIGKIARGLCLTVEELLDETADHSELAKARYKDAPHTGALTARMPSAHDAPMPSSLPWPFKLVSYGRLQALRERLGPKLGHEAMRDLDKYLDTLVARWEHEADARKSRDAA